MSLGFGFGLPHHVAVLGGGGPPATVYFLSLTSSSTAGVNLTPLSIYVDGSGNSIIFGYRPGGPAGENAFALKITSTGQLSVEDKFTLAASAAKGGPVDGSGNYYVAITDYNYYCCYGYSYATLLKLDQAFTKLAGLGIGTFGGYGYSGDVARDNAGNVWVIGRDTYAGWALFKSNAAVSSISQYNSWTSGSGGYGYFNTMAADSAGALVLTGERYYYWWDCCGCYYWYYPVIQSISTTTPTTTNWAWESPNLYSYGFGSVAVDSSNNVYTNLKNSLLKFNSLGGLLWQYLFTGITDITSIAFDASGNVYCMGLNISNALVIIKTNSSGIIQYSRTLTPTTGSMYIQPGWFNAQLKVQGSIMYITVGYLVSSIVKSVVFKVPTDGSLTQSFSVGGYSFTYAAGTVTQSGATVTLNTVTGYNLVAQAAPGTYVGLPNAAADGATTAVAIL